MNNQETKDLDGQQRLPGWLAEDWQNIFDAMGIGITASDKNGCFEIFNSKMQAITGYTLEQANACGDFSKFIYPDPLERQEALGRLNEIVQKSECHEIETRIQAKDGARKILLVSTSLINYKGQVMFLSVYQDVTQRRKAEQILKQVKDELEIQSWGLQKANEGIKVLYKELEIKTREVEKFDQLKSDFVSTVSHELRTPLAITKEGISLILDKIPGEINEKQERILSTARSNIDRLARIINELLDVSKIEAGKVELKRELVDIAGLVRQLTFSFGLSLKEKGLELKVNLPEKQIEAFVDSDKIIQVFTNLVGNALKFTAQGYIEISLRETEKEIECFVADTGLGVTEEELPKVFDKFQQFGRLPGPGAKGTGLGLSITKGIIELHGGKIWAESKPGAWTKFNFTLPKYTTEEIFKEYLNNGIREAMDKKACMALIVISIPGFNKLKEKFADEKIDAILRSMERVIRVTLRRKSDIVFKGPGELVIILADCNKTGALSVGDRLKEPLEKYLTDEKLSGEIKLKFGSAVYPDEAKNEQELMEKAKKA
ncbi:MAG: ATP-binding protein [Candidatus Omnitrophica bacterium]|nr:ATP-binding protein [Candidatus Omnitrophota bacterium]